MAKRDEPLRAVALEPEHLSGHAEAEAEMAVVAAEVAHAHLPAPPSGADPHAEARRLQRLADGVRGIRSGGGLDLGERVLMIIGGILAPLGLVIVIIGWNGAAHTPNLYEQVPYAISGGFLGLGLCFLGSFMYFVHWITQLVKEHRAQSAAVIEAITRLETAIATAATTTGLSTNGTAVPAAEAFGADVLLVATERGTMAHRPDCVVVAGKDGIRAVSPADGLVPCKLCDPYYVATN
jgi:multisubunit Na+/H+ antiporter MnhG subunit